jgi:sterol desaturase/sphingolipid hydroxylase (fatty acid hydroxylase superfamily)
VPVGLQAVVAAEYGVIGFLHGYVHDAFHIEGHWLERSRWFRRLRDLHAFHHRAMRTNLGIFWFGWDRAFGTFKSVKTPK